MIQDKFSGKFLRYLTKEGFSLNENYRIVT